EFPSCPSIKALIEQADAALYEAKRAGKNRVVAHEAEPVPGVVTSAPASQRSEEELRPGEPPVVAAGDDRARAGDLDVPAVAILLEPVGRRELDLDLARPARIVGLDCRDVLQRLSRALLDQIARTRRREVARAEAAEPDLHLRGRQPVAEQRTRLVAHRAVAGDEQNGAAPV